MKRTSVLLATALLAFVALPLAAGQNKSGEKATGTVTYHNGGDTVVAIFDAHEAIGDRGAKGTFLYVDQAFNYYLLQLTCVAVDPAADLATFGGNVEYSNFIAPGTAIQIWVYDGGTPGAEGDRIAGDVMAPDCGVLDPTTVPLAWLPIEGGNLAIHASH